MCSDYLLDINSLLILFFPPYSYFLLHAADGDYFYLPGFYKVEKDKTFIHLDFIVLLQNFNRYVS